ncbi:MAG: hypothetical protein JWP26_1841 [Devosia sp.]|uniref:DUF2628 domain-containing protein n=1 Tax=Devosia sp. TaxID=1871048 RepID=UPI0026270069|nr:DUF2628 domain-containing protein [Devosia sp.]MDB5586871.1 hypothetical protein [Devosia sp.]
MTLFAIFEPKLGITSTPAAIPEKFSWLAFLLPPVFALVHGLWLPLIAYIVAVIALGLAAAILGGAAAFWLYVLFALWIGFAAPGLRRQALSHRGWSHRGDRVATAPDLATLSWLESK